MSSETTQQNFTAYEILAWLETNKKALVIGFVAAVIVGSGIAIYRWKTEQTELAASDALLKLKTALSSSDTTNPPPATDFLKVAESYSGTSAGERALLLAASRFFAEGKYPEARANFSRFAREYPQNPFAATAAYGVAACLEAEGRQDEALADYQNLSVRYPNSSVLDDGKLAAARIYEAKKQPESALRVYDELARAATLAGSGSAAVEAMQRREALLAQHPGLIKTTNSAASTALEQPALISTNLQVHPATNSGAKKP